MKARRRASAQGAAGFLVLAVALIAYGAYTGLPRYRATHGHPSPPPSNVVTTTTADPDETPIDTSKVAYTVPADMPKTISLPSVGATGFIQRVGIDTVTHQLAVPTNIHFAGWYTGSVKPGDAGLSVIDGHITGRYAPGLFQNLNALRPKALISVTYGNGHSKNFEVVSVTTYELKDVMAALLHHDPAISNQLNLITCGGSYDSHLQTFTKRIVVVTKLQS